MAHIITSSLVPGDLVFDIGANLGDKAEWFAGRGFQVVCVEPQPAMIEKLNERFCNSPDIEVVGKGIGSARGTLKMSISSQTPALSTFSEHWKQGRFADMEWDSQADVEIILLDDLVQKYGVPRYCKIDVEGFELEVITGLSQRIGIISFEFTSEFMINALLVLEKLIALGYKKFNVSLGENAEFHLPQWVPYYELAATLFASKDTPLLWGDIYAN